MKTTDREQQILKIISNTTPFCIVTVTKVYERVMSYDDTIRVLNQANEENLNPLYILDKLDHENQTK